MRFYLDIGVDADPNMEVSGSIAAHVTPKVSFARMFTQSDRRDRLSSLCLA